MVRGELTPLLGFDHEFVDGFELRVVVCADFVGFNVGHKNAA